MALGGANFEMPWREEKGSQEQRERVLLKQPLAERSPLGSCAGNIGLAERQAISGVSELPKREKLP